MVVMYFSTQAHDDFEMETRAALADGMVVSPHRSRRERLDMVVNADWVVERAMRTRVIGGEPWGRRARILRLLSSRFA
jgi:hypothetical protein